jgi:hypothetical protein
MSLSNSFTKSTIFSNSFFFFFYQFSNPPFWFWWLSSHFYGRLLASWRLGTFFLLFQVYIWITCHTFQLSMKGPFIDIVCRHFIPLFQPMVSFLAYLNSFKLWFHIVYGSPLCVHKLHPTRYPSSICDEP